MTRKNLIQKKSLQKKINFILLVSLFTLGCHAIRFDRVMPGKSDQLNRFPSEVKGSYVKLNYNETKLTAEYMRLDKVNAQLLNVYTSDATYIDTSNVKPLALTTIDTAWFEDDIIHVKHDGHQTQIKLNDSVSGTPEKLAYRFDLDSNRMYHGGQRRSYDTCIIRKAKASFYINIGTDSNRWMVTEVKLDRHDLLINYLAVGNSATQETIQQVVNRYNLEQVSKPGRMISTDYMNASLSDEQFFDLVKETGFFESQHWYRMGVSKHSGIWLVLGLLALAGLLAIIITGQRRRKQARAHL
ncbi:MAG: hypothetical protein JJ975_10270 [Bacteroidia bacterium]|nr:hypothetical protein [Bacteroidia bacterium]